MHSVFDFPIDPKTDLELKLLRFFHDIFEQENLPIGCICTLQNSLNVVKKSFSKASIRSCSSKINFDRPETRCSYIYQYAPCFSSTVAQHFQNMLILNPWLLENALLADEIKVCSLGGGPATEFVAIAKSLEEMLWRHCPRGDRPLKLVFTVVDVNAGWDTTVQNVRGSLADLVDASMVQCELSFVRADLRKPLSKEVQDILRKSNIVTMTKYITAVYGTSGLGDVLCSMQAVTQNIQENGILFLIDSSNFDHYKSLEAVVNSSGDMVEIYGHGVKCTYEMSQYFLAESLRLYCRFYTSVRLPCYKSTNCINVWQKRRCSLESPNSKSEWFP